MGEYRPGNRVNSCTHKKHFGANAHGVKPSLSALIVTNAHFTVHFYYRVLTFTRGWVVGISLQSRILSDFAKLKQERLGAHACISQSVLSRIESGKYNDTLSVPMLLDIADGLQIDMSLLVSFNDVEKSMWWQPLSVKDCENKPCGSSESHEKEGECYGDDSGE